MSSSNLRILFRSVRSVRVSANGGKFWILAAEGITRKKIPEKYEAAISLVGLALLILLSLVITYYDITKLF